MIFIYKFRNMQKKQLVSIDSQVDNSLNLIERTVLYNIKLYETLEEKISYVENYYHRIVEEVFFDKKYIIETYNYKFVNDLIVESNFDFKRRIYEIHLFIKKALKFDYLSEQNKKLAAKTPTNNKTQTNNDLFKDAPSFNTMQVQGNQNPTAQSYPSIMVLNKLGWDGFFQTLKDSLSSTVFTVAKEAAKILFPAVGVGMKIAGYYGWGVLFIYDVYRNKFGEAVGDFFSLIASMIPGPLAGQVKKFMETSKNIAAGIASIDGIVKKMIDKLGLRETMVELAGTIAGMTSSFLDVLTKSVDWIEKQFGNTTKIFSQTLDKCKQIVDEIVKSINDYVKNFQPKVQDKSQKYEPNYIRRPQAGKI